MSLEKDFPVLSGAQQEKRNQENKIEIKKKEESFLERISRGGKKIALPAISALIALGSVKEGKAQSKSENIKRVLSMEQVMQSDGKVAFQENDSTVHMYDVKKRGNGTVKMKDLGTIITTKGDAVKVADLKENAPSPSVKEDKGNISKGDNKDNVQTLDVINASGREYKAYRTTPGGETPKDRATGQIRTLSDGTPKYLWVEGKGWYVASGEKGVSNKKEVSSPESIMKNGKKYLIHKSGESPFGTDGKIKANFIFSDNNYWKLAE